MNSLILISYERRKSDAAPRVKGVTSRVMAATLRVLTARETDWAFPTQDSEDSTMVGLLAPRLPEVAWSAALCRDGLL